MKKIILSFLFLNVALVLTGAECADLSAADTGSADVTIVRGEDEPVRLVHDPLLSQVALSPPAEGFMQLTFTYQDPLVYITLDVNGNALKRANKLICRLQNSLTRTLTLTWNGKAFNILPPSTVQRAIYLTRYSITMIPTEKFVPLSTYCSIPQLLPMQNQLIFLAL